MPLSMSRSVPVKVPPQPAVNATGSRNRRVLPLSRQGNSGLPPKRPAMPVTVSF